MVKLEKKKYNVVKERRVIYEQDFSCCKIFE